MQKREGIHTGEILKYNISRVKENNGNLFEK